MKNIIVTLICLLPIFCSAAEVSSKLFNAIKNETEISNDKSFNSVLIDLNGDCIKDAIVLLNGFNYCGSAGCNLLIFQGTNTGFKFISKSTITRSPIRVINSRMYGWNSLIVNTKGIGEVILKFNGSNYPLNPSLQPTATAKQIKNSKLVLKR